MLVTNISEFDAGEYIESDEDAIAYFNAMAETGDSTLLRPPSTTYPRPAA